jgi:acyl-CoA thioesterase I
MAEMVVNRKSDIENRSVSRSAAETTLRLRIVCMLLALLCVFGSTLGLAQTTKKPAASIAPTPSAQRTILVMGDSLSAAYGLSASQGWVSLTAQKIAKEKPGWRVVNASVSGETTAGGAARIAAALKRHKPSVVVIELGANDGLRGLPLTQIRTNLERMIAASKAANAKVMLIGMRLPPNYGPEYTQGFERAFRDLAQRNGTAYLPFLLQPIALDDRAFQADRLHPTASAQPKLRDHVWPSLAPLLK